MAGIYQGDWLYGVRRGNGAMKSCDDSLYVGEWYNDMKQGWGIMRFKSGVTFEGTWNKSTPKIGKWIDNNGIEIDKIEMHEIQEESIVMFCCDKCRAQDLRVVYICQDCTIDVFFCTNCRDSESAGHNPQLHKMTKHMKLR